MLNDPSPILFLDGQVRESFGLSAPSYYLDIVLASALLWPAVVAFNALANYCERRKEYDADRYAVRQGYGRELAALLKRIDRDELLNVNPHPFVAVVNRDHPPTARRVEAIMREVALME